MWGTVWGLLRRDTETPRAAFGPLGRAGVALLGTPTLRVWTVNRERTKFSTYAFIISFNNL
eukprot:SAG31_NODE_1762_length_7323_cov_10.940753_6_plen_61_part_00